VGVAYRDLAIEEQQDFVVFYELEHPRLYQLLRAIALDPLTAHEATDEAFVRALERWDRVGRMEHRNAWVRRVGINLIKRHWRQRRREESALARHGRPADEIADDYLIELLDLMAQLSPRARVAIALRYVLGMSEQETAEVMGVTPGTVGTTVHRARKKLAELLTDATEPLDVFGGEVSS
jgi:RNA polymerase sigma-70 factor (ECF subfamily)